MRLCNLGLWLFGRVRGLGQARRQGCSCLAPPAFLRGARRAKLRGPRGHCLGCGRPEAIPPARVPGRGWVRQFYNLPPGWPRGATFSCSWKAEGLRAGQRLASVLGTVPPTKVGRPRTARGNQTTGRVENAGSGAVTNSGASTYLLCDLRAFCAESL